jgi:hypothetical protein
VPSVYFPAVNAEFNWWLLIVGLVVGAGLVWFVLMDARRREADVDAAETTREAAWLSAILADEGWVVPPEAAERLLALHRSYLEAPPPDEVVERADPPPVPPDEVAPPDASELAGDDRVGLGT